MFRVEGTARAEVLRACLASKAQQGGQCAWNRVSRGEYMEMRSEMQERPDEREPGSPPYGLWIVIQEGLEATGRVLIKRVACFDILFKIVILDAGLNRLLRGSRWRQEDQLES